MSQSACCLLLRISNRYKAERAFVTTRWILLLRLFMVLKLTVDKHAYQKDSMKPLIYNSLKDANLRDKALKSLSIFHTFSIFVLYLYMGCRCK